MFGRKKKVNTNNIKTFSDAIKAIKVFIYLKEWEKAQHAIQEIQDVELHAFQDLEIKLKWDYSASQKQKKNYEKHKAAIEKLSQKLEVRKLKYDRDIELERFKIRFTRIKQEIKKLTATGKNNDALNLLTHFLEDNRDKPAVVTFYDKEKKKILKSIEEKKVKDKKKGKYNAEIEALKLIWKTIKTAEDKKKEKEKRAAERKENWFIAQLKKRMNFRHSLKEKLEKKKLLDEIKILIEEESKAKQEIAEKKLENIHKWLVKELYKHDMVWYDIYGKILWYDKISWDTFGFIEAKEKYNFFIGDATGHWVRAGLIVSLLSKNFQEHSLKNDLQNTVLKTNNNLKENLQSRNFATWIFFEIHREYKGVINFVGLGHEPILVYRAKTKKIERIIPGGLAGWIRLIKKAEEVQVKSIEMADDDIMLTFSDGVVEAKDNDGNFYGLDKLEKAFKDAAKLYTDVNKLYDSLIEDLKFFKSGTSFLDDTTLLLLKRNEEKDVLTNESVELREITEKEGLSKKQSKRLAWKNKEEIEEELEKIRKEKEIDNIIKVLEWYYLTGEVLKLKQEATRFIKEGYIHKKINFYLKKAIAKENQYRVEQKNTKMKNKYSVLQELYKKNDFKTVIQEINEIIAKDGNI